MTSTIDRLPSSATRAASAALRSLLGSRRRQLLLAAIVLTLGLALKWNWLVAVGIAPVILSVLPCVVMCALGLCMMRMGSGPSGSPSPSADAPSTTTTPVQSAALSAGSTSGAAEDCCGKSN